MTWTPPRSWVAAEVVDQFELNAQVRDNLLALVAREQIVVKTDTQSIASSVVLTNDDQLLLPVVAGKTYVLEGFLLPSCTSGSVNMRLGFSFPAGTLALGADIQVPATPTASTGGNVKAWGSATIASGSDFMAIGVPSGASHVGFQGSFVCNASGNVQLMWCQNASSATALSLNPGSWMRLIATAP